MAASAALLLAACGGGGSTPKSSATNGDGGSNTTTTTDAGHSGNNDCFTTPGTQKARVRFVNLFTNSTYPSGDIDVYQGFSGTDPCGKKLATVKYGTATDYIDVTAGDESGNWSTTAFIAGSTDHDHQIVSQGETWKGGEQITMVFQGGEPLPDLQPAAGGDQTFFESGTGSDSIAAVPGKAVLAIGAASVQYVHPDGAWVAGVNGMTSCLNAKGDTETSHTNIGGTSLEQYSVAPGSVELALYAAVPGKCTGTADIGPTTIDAAAGTRTFVLVYGSDAKALKLLVLPIED